MANDFSGDNSCKALWNLEDGALTADSKGTNTLTNNGVTADTGDYKQGSGSGVWVSADQDYLYSADGDLDSGFPGKSGEANRIFTFCMWVKPASVTQYLFIKQTALEAHKSYGLLFTSSGRLSLMVSDDGDGWIFKGTSITYTLDLETWYHIAVWHNDGTGDWGIRVHDTSSLITHQDKTGAIAFHIGASEFFMGWVDIGSGLDGKADEIVVFDRVLNIPEIDRIWAGTYSGPVSVLGLAGTTTGTSTVSGAVGANPVSVLGLAGTSVGVSSITGVIEKIDPLLLAGTVVGTSSVTGAVADAVTIPSLAGLVEGTSSVTGAIGANPVSVLGLAGTSAGTSSVTGAIAAVVPITGLSGTVAGVSSVTGSVMAILYLTGTVAGVSSVTGAIGVNPVVVSSLAGVIVGISSVTGSVLLKGEDVILSFPSTRASDYDPDLVWDEDTGTWTSDEDLLRRDGSRHKTQLVVVGKDLIYYGAID